MFEPALIGVDWGTTALRGALLTADGTVLAEHAAPRGLLSIEPGTWAAAFEAEFGAWRAAHPDIPCLMAGMVGSRQGWAEAPYCRCPAGLDDYPAVYECKILITELSFIRAAHKREKIHKYGHMHVDDFIEREGRFRNELIVAGHFSTRYHPSEVVRMLDRKLPPGLRAKMRLWI